MAFFEADAERLPELDRADLFEFLREDLGEELSEDLVEDLPEVFRIFSSRAGSAVASKESTV